MGFWTGDLAYRGEIGQLVESDDDAHRARGIEQRASVYRSADV